MCVFLVIQLLEKAGFVDVKAIDNTKRFIEVLTSERARFETDKNTFLKVWKFDIHCVLNIVINQRKGKAKTVHKLHETAEWKVKD